MKIVDYLDKNNICLNLNLDTKDDIIEFLGGLLEKSGCIKDYKNFVIGVKEREKIASTYVGNEIAIPHARTDLVDNFVIAVGRSEKPIEFEGGSAKLFFLMGTPESSGIRKYLHLLAHLSRILKKDVFRKNLFNAKNSEDVLKAFEKIEKE